MTCKKPVFTGEASERSSFATDSTGKMTCMKTPLLSAAIVVLTGILSQASAQEYVLHEWGTFTAVIGSDGTHLDGVHLEDAPLPEFVYELDDTPKLQRAGVPEQRFTKGRAIDPARQFVGVNVRLETPVLYFYTDESFDAQVDVGFRGGSIGQWFPQRSGGEAPAPAGQLDFNQPRDGSIRWNVLVEPATDDAAQRVFRSGELPCWLYPRYPDSALVTNAQNETEKYLFYRGLGRMELPVTFTATDTQLVASNTGKHAVPQWLVFDLNENRQARWSVRGPLRPGTTSSSVNLDSQPYNADWKQELYADGVKMLMDAGLFRKEADAMLQTWWASYFETPGLRVFWIVPRAQVDRVLPLQVSPEPKQTERVIVGRSEILRPSFEAKLVAGFAAADGREMTNRWRNDRFFPAYDARVRQIKRTAGSQRSIVQGRPVGTGPTTSITLPVGKWTVVFANGVVQTTQIHADGTATVTQSARSAAGTATVKDGFVEIRYDDDRAERWMVGGDTLTVQHWHPIRDMPDKPAVLGTAERIRMPPHKTSTWDDRISSARVGANVRVIAYEHRGFRGRSVELVGSLAQKPGKGNYALLLNVVDGLQDSRTQKSPTQNPETHPLESWNDSFSALKVVAIEGAKGENGDGSDEVLLYENSHFQGASMRLRVGDQIPDLSRLRPNQTRPTELSRRQ
ncbi:MAG: hypothetical protein HKN47_06645 [Pirellulaceae bacterium]|nr:hypothetical protein [Pirellulaceae bacterium]